MKALSVFALFIILAAIPTDGELLCACPRIYFPLCGKDGKTYGNKCELNCAQVGLLHNGECRQRTPLRKRRKVVSCACPFILLQECGTNGITYGNSCVRKCSGVKLAHPGPCRRH